MAPRSQSKSMQHQACAPAANLSPEGNASGSAHSTLLLQLPFGFLRSGMLPGSWQTLLLWV